MEAKYYTPKIEEFHVGFEYYYKIIADKSFDYQFNVIDKYTQIESIYESIVKGKIFVKYLDREDIESLGWKYVLNNGHLVRYELNDFAFVQGIGPLRYTNMLISLKFRQMTFGDNSTESIVFDGDVKNKSVLKNLMDMVFVDEAKYWETISNYSK